MDAEPHVRRRLSPAQVAVVGLLLLVTIAGGTFAVELAKVSLAPAAPGVGDRAPVFRAARVPGPGAVDLEALRGRVVLLDFWATWCSGCVAAMPVLDRLEERYGPRGLTVVGLNQEPEHVEEVLAFLEVRGIRFANVVDTGTIAEAFGVWALPSSVLVDREGHIRVVRRGGVEERLWQRDIEAALGQR